MKITPFPQVIGSSSRMWRDVKGTFCLNFNLQILRPIIPLDWMAYRIPRQVTRRVPASKSLRGQCCPKMRWRHFRWHRERHRVRCWFHDDRFQARRRGNHPFQDCSKRPRGNLRKWPAFRRNSDSSDSLPIRWRRQARPSSFNQIQQPIFDVSFSCLAHRFLKQLKQSIINLNI